MNGIGTHAAPPAGRDQSEPAGLHCGDLGAVAGARWMPSTRSARAHWNVLRANKSNPADRNQPYDFSDWIKIVRGFTGDAATADTVINPFGGYATPIWRLTPASYQR
ncbi:hypothetical protein ACFVYA_04945 [Amycolatopsis sp. NPDC058278]|uniref:hypothetical protein n=1 Tax=Amycolatopsis sp. NPDC058278 TaxID=3346417 RepID=UPI0036DD15CE